MEKVNMHSLLDNPSLTGTVVFNTKQIHVCEIGLVQVDMLLSKII